MGLKFTPEQEKAITTLDKSILVSAAAGSGKTAVLVERIIRIILEGKADVDQMLVVTFTKAAASEMRLRLSKAIRKRMKEHPEDAERMHMQLSKLYKAYITTIDSFALRIIREFFYEIDIEPDFGACDEVQGELMKRDAINELFEDAFDKDDMIEGCSFREFLRLYSDERSEEKFKNNMLSAYDSLRSMPGYLEWAYDSAEALNVTLDTFEGSKLQKTMRDDAKETLAIAYEAACKVRQMVIDINLEDMYEAKLADEVNQIISLYEAVLAGNFDVDIINNMISIEYARLQLKKIWKEPFEPIKVEVGKLRKVYKDTLDGYKKRYVLPDLETRIAEMNATYKYTVYYIRLLEEFERRYSAKKKEQRVLDFADMEHYAVQILQNEDAASTLRKRFEFIFVDEYQDTNKIQESLIARVSRPDNVFKVGDLKQSIYKFRQAEPEIFKSLYDEYSSEKTEDGIAIDLSTNYRSNVATINYVNTVFRKIMDGYDERAQLNPGLASNPDYNPDYDFIPDVYVLENVSPDDSAQSDSDDESESTEVIDDDSHAEIDDEIVSLSEEEAEAAYIADIAASLIGKEFQDTKTGQVRKAEARDIAILLRATKVRGALMARALRSRGLESHVEQSDNFFDTVEIGVAMSLLTCIDNIKRDIPLIAALHSEAFNWSPEELAKVRIAHNEYLRARAASQETKKDNSWTRPAYWEALEWFTNEGPEGPLKEKAIKVSETILRWRSLARMMPLEEFVWKVLTDSGYYMMAGAMNGGARRQANLRFLADKAGKFSSDKVASLSSFISFIDVLRHKKVNNGQAPMVGSDDNVVRICTIHKSKGLEYPFVIVGGLGHRFRYDTNEKNFIFDSSIGVGLAYIDPKRRFWRSTLMQRAMIAKSRRDSYAEELRVLYVAMTRARNKLILVGTTKKPEKLDTLIPNPGNFLEVIREVIKVSTCTHHFVPLNATAPDNNKSTADSIMDTIPEVMRLDAIELYRQIDDRFTYEYPDTDLLTAKAKYSVSEIRREEAENEIAGDATPAGDNVESKNTAPKKYNVAAYMRSRKTSNVSAADVGTAYHRIMEFVDFGRVMNEAGDIDKSYIDERMEVLKSQGVFKEGVAERLECDKIAEFFMTPLGKRAAAAARKGMLKKEKPFTLKTKKSGRDVLVQGVIDCCFEEDGKMVLLDYKTSFIDPDKKHEDEVERIRNEYKVQIDLYSEAVRKGTGMEVSEAYLYLFASGEAVRF